MAAVAMIAATVAGVGAPASAGIGALDGQPRQWVVEQRAALGADHLEDGPPSGAQATAANGRTGPFAGQVIPGFSGILDNGDGTLWGLPDNGFGAKTNSADFLLRLYLVRPHWESAAGGEGTIEVLSHVSLRDPRRMIPFPIVNETTPDRLLTGADFDVESVVAASDGSFWIGEEFGPFLFHVDATGVVLSAPVPFVGGKSPQHPTLGSDETPTVARSRGFEAMAASPGGRYLYPIVEGALTTDKEPRRRWIYEFDTRAGRYTGTRWAYETDLDANVIGDAVMADRTRMLLIERDDFDGAKAVTKKVYEVRLDRADVGGYAPKALVADLLYLRNPDGIAQGSGYGSGDPFAFPMQSVESLVLLEDGRLLIGNDNNYPGNAARTPGSPDDTEMIVIAPLQGPEAHQPGPIVIGHRGASGERPEHTIEAYELALRQCADAIEPDVVSTKDGVLVARHENEISGTTDIADRPEFAALRTTKVIDGTSVSGWFTEDLTLAQLRTLRAKERLPQIRAANTAYDGLFDVPTLEEVLILAQSHVTCDGNPVIVYPETKHPTYFDSIGLSLEEPLVALLERYGYTDEHDPVFVQSFETANLQELDHLTDVPLVQLINCSGAPYDLVATGDARSYAELATAEGLHRIAEYADGVGVCKDVMIPRTEAGGLAAPTPVIADAHAAGLLVHGWTFRAENTFLPVDLRAGSDPTARGDLAEEVRSFLAAGMDGLFSDQPADAVHAAAPFGA